MSADVADWNPFDQASFQKESDSFGAEFDMIRQDNVKSKENLVMTEDVFSSAPFSLPGTIQVFQSLYYNLILKNFFFFSVSRQGSKERQLPKKINSTGK